jgi:sterol desaturase/sphingolipid hydroxylase (fatty acid hydroxylase superfamily)
MDAVFVGLFALAVICTALEALLARRRGFVLYRPRELLCDLGCALAGFSVLALHRGLFLALYVALHRAAGAGCLVVDGAAGFALAFLLYDLVYYVDHRSTHTFGWLWASHRVHHETQAFHLLTGLRMSMVGPLLGYPFRLPLALLGVPPAVYFAVDTLHALCTYFTHARFAGDLRVGFLLNTPAHHRLHHSSAPEHFGKNYGGVLLIWDRLLGTYQPPSLVTSFGDGETPVALGPVASHRRMLRDVGKRLEPWLRARVTLHARKAEARASRSRHPLNLPRELP